MCYNDFTKWIYRIVRKCTYMEQSDIDFFAEIVSKENKSLKEKIDNLEKKIL